MAMKSITNETFSAEVLESTLPVLVEFTAPWCVYCRRIAPVLNRMADKLEGTVSIVQVDVDQQEALAEQYGVETIPALFLFQNGVPGDAIIAPGSQAQIEDWMNEQLA